MFIHVETMRKRAFKILAKTYGARGKDATINDAYPLRTLAKLLCFEDMDEARAACKHYNITVKTKEVQSSSGSRREVIVFWKATSFREATDEERGHTLPLKPKKMLRTIESKLKGVTRLDICRGLLSSPTRPIARDQSIASASARDKSIESVRSRDQVKRSSRSRDDNKAVQSVDVETKVKERPESSQPKAIETAMTFNLAAEAVIERPQSTPAPIEEIEKPPVEKKKEPRAENPNTSLVLNNKLRVQQQAVVASTDQQEPQTQLPKPIETNRQHQWDSQSVTQIPAVQLSVQRESREDELKKQQERQLVLEKQRERERVEQLKQERELVEAEYSRRLQTRQERVESVTRLIREEEAAKSKEIVRSIKAVQQFHSDKKQDRQEFEKLAMDKHQQWESDAVDARRKLIWLRWKRCLPEHMFSKKNSFNPLTTSTEANRPVKIVPLGSFVFEEQLKALLADQKAFQITDLVQNTRNLQTTDFTAAMLHIGVVSDRTTKIGSLVSKWISQRLKMEYPWVLREGTHHIRVAFTADSENCTALLVVATEFDKDNLQTATAKGIPTIKLNLSTNKNLDEQLWTVLSKLLTQLCATGAKKLGRFHVHDMLYEVATNGLWEVANCNSDDQVIRFCRLCILSLKEEIMVKMDTSSALWPSPVFWANGMVKDFFSNGVDLPEDWNSLDRVRSSLHRLESTFDGDLEDVILKLTADHNAEFQQECLNLVRDRMPKRALQVALQSHSLESSHQELFLYMAPDKCRHVVGAVVSKLRQDVHQSRRDAFRIVIPVPQPRFELPPTKRQRVDEGTKSRVDQEKKLSSSLDTKPTCAVTAVEEDSWQVQESDAFTKKLRKILQQQVLPARAPKGYQ